MLLTPAKPNLALSSSPPTVPSLAACFRAFALTTPSPNLLPGTLAYTSSLQFVSALRGLALRLFPLPHSTHSQLHSPQGLCPLHPTSPGPRTPCPGTITVNTVGAQPTVAADGRVVSPPPSLPLQPRIGPSLVQTCWPESIPGSPLPGAPSVLWAQVCARSPGRTPGVLMARGRQLGAQRAVPRVSDCPWRPPPAACPSHPASLSCGRGVGGSHREAALGSLPEDHGQTWTGVSEEFQGFFRRPTNVSLPQTCTGNSENPQDWGHWGLCFRETHCKPEL